jgi:cyanophycin synthetase
MPEADSCDPLPARAGTVDADRYGIQLYSQWRVLKGLAYGLKQATMLGKVHVAVPKGFSFTDLDEIVAPLFDELVPEPERPLDPASGLIHRLLSWQAAVQRQQKLPVLGSYMATRLATSKEPGREYLVGVSYHAPRATMEACSRIVKIMNRVLHDPVSSPESHSRTRIEFEQLLQSLKTYALSGINNFHLLDAARGLDIPVRGIFPDTYCLGIGARRRWLQSTMTDRTPALGVNIAHSKSNTALMLREHGVPVPSHGAAGSEEQAVLAAHKLGFPVVVKPDDQEQGRGVTAGLRDEEAVRAAYRRAREHSKKILVEKHHDGQDYRLTVYQGQVIKILNRRAGGVFGDGVHTIGELVDAEHQTTRFRKVYQQTGKLLLKLDEEALALLAQEGLAPDSVPGAGEFVRLRSKSNISAGGIQTLIPVHDAHPDNLDLAVRATAAMHLDICGVDLLIADISASWMETGAVIIEMNAKPQIGYSLAPEVYQLVVRGLVQGDGRIPVQLVICATQTECPGEDEALALMKASQCDGLSMSQGVWVDGRRLVARQQDGFAAARVLLLSDAVHSAVCVMTADDILQNGLPADRFARITVRNKASASPREKSILHSALAMLGAGGPRTRFP